MKKITLFLIAVMLSITVAAQSYTLRGVVEDTSGEPLAGATVQNKDTKSDYAPISTAISVL